MAVTTHRKKKGIMPVKGYYERARMFGYIALLVGLGVMAYYIFQFFTS
jgi:inner membrane protein involved in colicin E2 resistance